MIYNKLNPKREESSDKIKMEDGKLKEQLKNKSDKDKSYICSQFLRQKIIEKNRDLDIIVNEGSIYGFMPDEEFCDDTHGYYLKIKRKGFFRGDKMIIHFGSPHPEYSPDEWSIRVKDLNFMDLVKENLETLKEALDSEISVYKIYR